MTDGPRCARHQAVRDAQQAEAVKLYDQQRGSPQARGYDERWKAVRDQVLALHPVCRCGRPSVLVHHVTPIREGGARLDPRNLMAICGACHQREHGRLDRAAMATKARIII